MTDPDNHDARPADAATPPASLAEALPKNTGAALIVDWKLAVEHMDGREELLCQLAETFHIECASLTAQIREALATGDAKRLRRAAHTLKGSASVFCAQLTVDAARAVEVLAAEGQCDAAQAAWPALERAVTQLLPELAARVKDAKH